MRTYEEIMESGKLWNVRMISDGCISGLVKLPDCGTCSVIYGNNKYGYEHVRYFQNIDLGFHQGKTCVC